MHSANMPHKSELPSKAKLVKSTILAAVFGTLLMGGHDWDTPALWRRSMELLARDVMPTFSSHAASTPAR